MALVLTSRVRAGHRPLFAGVNWGHSLAQGLVSFVPCESGYVRDVVTNTFLAARSGTELRPASQGGFAVLADADNEAYAVTAPQKAQIAARPVTFGAWVYHVTNGDADRSFFGVTHNTSNSAPYTSYLLGTISNSTTYGIHSNDGTTYRGLNTGISTGTGTWKLVVVRLDTASSQLWVNGAQAYSGAGYTDIAYGATAQVFLGDGYPSANRNPSSWVCDYTAWNRLLSHQEIAQWYAEKWPLYWQPSNRMYLDVVAAAAAHPLPQRVLVGPTVGPLRGPF